MSDTENNVKTNGHTDPRTPHTADPEQEMLYKLKAAIDQRGRYAYRLNDMAAGYAAGRGISAMTARIEIENRFAETFGHSPHKYLEYHYDQLRENGQLRRRPGDRER